MIEPCKNKASINSAICHHHRPSAAVPIFTCYYCFQISMNCPNFHLLLLYQISIFFWTKCMRSLWDAAWTAVSVFCALCLRSSHHLSTIFYVYATTVSPSSLFFSKVSKISSYLFFWDKVHRHLFSSGEFHRQLLRVLWPRQYFLPAYHRTAELKNKIFF